jgi:hypothetical protein
LPIGWLRRHFADENGRLRMSMQWFVVRTPTRRIIVDRCLGNGEQNRRIPQWNDRDGPFLADLADAGFPPTWSDTVLGTHCVSSIPPAFARLRRGRTGLRRG